MYVYFVYSLKSGCLGILGRIAGVLRILGPGILSLARESSLGLETPWTPTLLALRDSLAGGQLEH